MKLHHYSGRNRQRRSSSNNYFFINDAAPAEIYTLSLHDALPIFDQHAIGSGASGCVAAQAATKVRTDVDCALDRKSTRLNFSDTVSSYAVVCLQYVAAEIVTAHRGGPLVNEHPGVAVAAEDVVADRGVGPRPADRSEERRVGEECRRGGWRSRKARIRREHACDAWATIGDLHVQA